MTKGSAGQLAYFIMSIDMSYETLATLAMESWQDNDLGELTEPTWTKFGLGISEATHLGFLTNYYVTVQFE